MLESGRFLTCSNFEPGTGKGVSRRATLPARKPAKAPHNLIGETVLSRSNVGSPSLDDKYDIRLRWSPIPWRATNGPITKYTLYWRESRLENGVYQNITCYVPYNIFENVQVDEK